MTPANGLQSSSPRKKWLISLAIVALMLTGFWWWVIYPNFVAHQSLARRIEAKTKLALIFEAEHAFYAKHHRFGNFDEIGYPSTQNSDRRYTYRLDRSGAPETIRLAGIGYVTSDNTFVPAGLSPDGQSFTVTATANLDNDDTVDQWHVNEMKLGLQVADMDDVFERVKSSPFKSQEQP